MRWIVWVISCLVFICPVHGQATFKAGFGMLVPLYDLDEPLIRVDEQIGLGGHGGIQFQVNPSLSLIVEAGYYRNGIGLKDFVAQADADVSSISGNAGIMFQSLANPALYGFLAPGVGKTKGTAKSGGESLSVDEKGFNILIGTGIRYAVNDNVGIFVEGRYTHTFHEDAYKAIPILAGVFFTSSE